jgi:multiple sugar transport system ATP-binding protein
MHPSPSRHVSLPTVPAARSNRTAEAGLHVSGLEKAFGRTQVSRGVDFNVPPGVFVALSGASGCGKATPLHIIAGLKAQDAGSLEIASTPLDHLRPALRGVVMVFQSYGLYTHMTVAQNIGMPLEMRRLTLPERLPLVREKVPVVVRELLIEELLDRRPGQPSGGRRRLVALSRATVSLPRLFLFGKPLSPFDDKLRLHMEVERVDLHRRLGVTVVYVTHD